MNTIEVIKNWIDKESEVLDLGCGDGEIINILSKEWGSRVLGVEINQDDINKRVIEQLSFCDIRKRKKGVSSLKDGLSLREAVANWIQVIGYRVH